MKRWTACIIILALLLSGCGAHTFNRQSVPSFKGDPSRDYAKVIREADTIVLKTDQDGRFIYRVYVRDEPVARIDMVLLKRSGDRFTLSDANGKKLLVEKHLRRGTLGLARLGTMKDGSGATVGYMKEQLRGPLIKSGYSFQLLDRNKQQIGNTSLIRMPFNTNIEFTNTRHEQEYSITKQSGMNNTYTIKKLSKHPAIHPLQVIMMICVQEKIYVQDKDENWKKKNQREEYKRKKEERRQAKVNKQERKVEKKKKKHSSSHY